MKRLVRCLRNKSGSAFPLIISITLALALIMSGVIEYFRLSIIASGVKEAFQDAIIVTVNENYTNVYHGVREGYSGGYQPIASSFEDSVDTGDIYRNLKRVLGLQLESGRYVKYSGRVVEYSLSGLEVEVRNVPFAPSSPATEPNFEADAVMVLEVPVQFAGKQLPAMKIKLKVQAGYTEVFERH